MDDGFVVAVPIKQYNLYSMFMTRWVEDTVGDIWTDWDIPGKATDEEQIFAFRQQCHAEHFARVWTRTPLIFPYEVWEEFCNLEIGRARIQGYWRGQGWTPKAVYLNSGPAKKSLSAMQGARRQYRQSMKVWFFEEFTDAMVFWMEQQ
jgi:hypothetical protein